MKKLLAEGQRDVPGKHHLQSGMEFTIVERETVGLWVACGALDSMVNHVLLKLAGDGGAKEVHFETFTHRQLFNILLLDFLENVDMTLTGEQGSCLEVLEGACQTASFDEKGSVKFLRGPVNALRTWLGAEITVDTWLPSIHEQLDLKIQRRESIYICGNISKHNLARLTGATKRLDEILRRHNVTVGHLKALHILDDFYVRFHEDIFEYHSTVIAELLNNVRWGIHDYLNPEYLGAKVQNASDQTKYSYRYPEDVSDDFARSCYWDLMNTVRRKPNMERFIANSSFKLGY